MTLPQFTGGSVGKLTFSHLNEAFNAIDGLDREVGSSVDTSFTRGRIVLARVTGIVAGKIAWVEIRRSGTQFAAVPNGRSSIEGGNVVAYPIVGFGNPQPAVGTDLAIFPAYDADGALYYFPISPPAAGTSMIGIVQGVSSTVTQNQRWLYNVNEVYFNVNSYAAVPGGRSVIANNGCENAVDAPQNIGVGQATGIAQNLVRRPIKSGTVVTLVQDAVISSQYTFSIPNGYEFTCP